MAHSGFVPRRCLNLPGISFQSAILSILSGQTGLEALAEKNGVIPRTRRESRDSIRHPGAGKLAAMHGHGVAMADLRLTLDALKSGLLALPFREAIATGDGYYLVWPKKLAQKTEY